MEQLNHSRFTLPKEFVWMIAGSLTIVGIGNIAVGLVHRVSPQDRYLQSYTSGGKCLSETPYSTSNGATISQIQALQTGSYQISVTPAQTGIKLPPLVFNTNYGQLSAANQFTYYYLSGNDCPLNTGG